MHSECFLLAEKCEVEYRVALESVAHSVDDENPARRNGKGNVSPHPGKAITCTNCHGAFAEEAIHCTYHSTPNKVQSTEGRTLPPPSSHFQTRIYGNSYGKVALAFGRVIAGAKHCRDSIHPGISIEFLRRWWSPHSS